MRCVFFLIERCGPSADIAFGSRNFGASPRTFHPTLSKNATFLVKRGSYGCYSPRERAVCNGCIGSTISLHLAARHVRRPSRTSGASYTLQPLDPLSCVSRRRLRTDSEVLSECIQRRRRRRVRTGAADQTTRQRADRRQRLPCGRTRAVARYRHRSALRVFCIVGLRARAAVNVRDGWYLSQAGCGPCATLESSLGLFPPSGSELSAFCLS